MSLTIIILAVLSSLTLGTAVICLALAFFGGTPVVEPPVQRRVAIELGVDRPTIFDVKWLTPLLSWSLAIARRISLPSLRQHIRQQLDASGNPFGYSVDEYLAISIMGGFVLTVCAAAIDLIAGSGLMLIMVPVGFFLGAYIPLSMLQSSAGKRTRAISKQLPYTLDLVALTMSSGSSFTEAIQTLIRDNPDDPLNEEFRLAMAEMDMGSSRQAALTNIANRIPLDTLRSIIAAINQADTLGTSLSEILKLQADMLRVQRSVRAEKLAASASLRILIPSMLILLAVVVLLFAPFIVRWSQGELL